MVALNHGAVLSQPEAPAAERAPRHARRPAHHRPVSGGPGRGTVGRVACAKPPRPHPLGARRCARACAWPTAVASWCPSPDARRPPPSTPAATDSSSLPGGERYSGVWQGATRPRVSHQSGTATTAAAVIPLSLPRPTGNRVRALPAPVDSFCRHQPPPPLPAWVWVQVRPVLGACARRSPTVACAWSAPAGGLRAPNPPSPTVSHLSWVPFTLIRSLVACTNLRLA